MDREKIFQVVLIGLLLVLLYLSFLILKPFASYIVLALVLGYLFHPLYRWFAKRMPHSIAALLIILLVLLLLIIPSAYIVTKLASQSVDAYNSISAVVLEDGVRVFDTVLAPTGLTTEELIRNAGMKVRDYALAAAPTILGTVAEVLLGLFVMFFLLYFALVEGERWVTAAKRSVPLGRLHKERLFARIGSITYAVMYGQFLTAVIQGILGGVMFAIFGIPNPIFWGFIMMIMGFIPTLGTPLVFIPAAVIQIIHQDYVAGFGILIFGILVITNIDNFLKPKLIGGRANISTPLALLGVFGGLSLFGFMGIILGPLILALLQTVLQFFNEDMDTKA